MSRFLWDLVTIRQGYSVRWRSTLCAWEILIAARPLSAGEHRLTCLSFACRGYKTVVKAFSSEVANLEPVLALLLRCDTQVFHIVRHAERLHQPVKALHQMLLHIMLQGGRVQARNGDATEGLWQAQCTLLLWLSQLLLIPFDLASVDSSAGVGLSAAPG